MTVRYSHPPSEKQEGTRLEAHLQDVAGRVEHIIPEDARTPSGESLRTVVETIGYLHDFGKATTFFQQYIGTRPGTPEDDRLRYHAPLGSFVTFYALDAMGFATETCLAGFVAVAKHHGRLPNVTSFVFDRAHRREGVASGSQTQDERVQSHVARQIADIDSTAASLADTIVSEATRGEGSWTEFRDGFFEVLEAIETAVGSAGLVPEPRTDPLSETYYGFQLRCWGALVLADKTSAAGAPPTGAVYRGVEPPTGTLADYVEHLESTVVQDREGTRRERLNYFRSAAHEDVLNGVRAIPDSGQPVATITLPTGMGKTLTGLTAAFHRRDITDGDRIVYALPFTSIIDQVVEEVRTIFDADLSGGLLTAHHHLAETTIRSADEEGADLSDDVAGMLGESWRAGLTVTTYVQLFESLAGPKNTQSMKVPALQDAVIVLDEPQSLPLDWWKLVPRLVELLTEQFDATVIAMTATQPRLFENEFELVDDPDTYFEAVHRVTYELDASVARFIENQDGPRSYEDAAATLRDEVRDGHSTLAICNTIESARTLTERTSREDFVDVNEVYADLLSETGEVDAVSSAAIANRVERSGDPATLHLSTRLRPADRLVLLEAAKELTAAGVPLAVISTQLIEAGVDISFETVYRDLAPIDSIVQAAGRCNRSFERETGTVTVWWLDAPGDRQRTPAEAVYNRGAAILPIVAETLAEIRDETGTLTETAVARTAVDRFFERLREDKDVGKREYVEWVDHAMAEDLGSLSLIDERLAGDVLVARTPAERATVNDIRDAADRHDYETVRRLLDETKPLRVSIPYYNEESPVAESLRTLSRVVDGEGLFALPVARFPEYFSATFGVSLPDSSVEHQFL